MAGPPTYSVPCTSLPGWQPRRRHGDTGTARQRHRSNGASQVY